jgi:hypothetical protein
MKEQLTLNDLCGYLPYDLKWQYWIDKNNNSINIMSCGNMPYIISDSNKKPIFRNLATDLTREIKHNGSEPFMPLEELLKNSCFNTSRMSLEEINNYKEVFTPPFISYEDAKTLMQWHFWLGDQSYFEKGIILDFNDVNQ